MEISNSDISRLVSELHVPAHLKGRESLIEALIIVTKEGKNIQVTKSIYYPIAKKNKTTPSAVERSIKYLINQLWEARDLSKYGFCMKDKPPTTKNFILTLFIYLNNETKEKPED